MTILVIAVYAVIGAREIPRLVKAKYWKELVVHSLLLAGAATLSALYVSGARLPDPIKGVKWLLDALNLHF